MSGIYIDGIHHITTYKAKCDKYFPNKEKPTSVMDIKIGETYECNNFVFDKDKDKQGLWTKDIELGNTLCFLCANYNAHNNNIKQQHVEKPTIDWCPPKR